MKRSNTKERIIEAALDLFSIKGYDGVGVDQIAEEAGIKGPSLYRHFKSKTEILSTITSRAEQYYEEKVFGGAESCFPASAAELYEYSMKQIEATLDDAVIIKFRKFITKEQFRNSRIGRLASIHSQAEIEDLYSRVFSDMISKGIIKPYSPEVLAMEYVSPVTMLIHLCDREPSRRQEVLDKIRAHLRHFISVYGV